MFVGYLGLDTRDATVKVADCAHYGGVRGCVDWRSGRFGIRCPFLLLLQSDLLCFILLNPEIFSLPLLICLFAFDLLYLSLCLLSLCSVCGFLPLLLP